MANATRTAASSRAYGGDLLMPAAEALRERLGVAAPRPLGARFAVALTHDVDVVWRWTRLGVKGALWRARHGDLRQLAELARAPAHRFRGTDPWWRFRELLDAERRLGARSTFFVLAANRVPEDGLAPTSTTGCVRGSSRSCGKAAPRSRCTRRTARPTSPVSSMTSVPRWRRSPARSRGALPLPPARSAPEPRTARRPRVRLVARVRGRPRLPRQRTAVPPVGPRARPAVRPRRDPDGGDGRTLAEPHYLGLTPEAASRRWTRCSIAQQSWAPPSPSSGTPSASTRLPPAAGTASTSASSRESRRAAASAWRQRRWPTA